MVVKTLIKQSFVSIKQTFNRFISILVIVLLGVGFFTGIRETSPNMKDSLDKYWDNIHKEYISTYDGWFNKYINLLHKDDNIVDASGSDYIINVVKDKQFNKAKILVKYIESYFEDNGGKC